MGSSGGGIGISRRSCRCYARMRSMLLGHDLFVASEDVLPYTPRLIAQVFELSGVGRYAQLHLLDLGFYTY